MFYIVTDVKGDSELDDIDGWEAVVDEIADN